MTAEEAELEEAKGNHTVQVEGGYRRIVAAPKPMEIVEIDAIILKVSLLFVKFLNILD